MSRSIRERKELGIAVGLSLVVHSLFLIGFAFLWGMKGWKIEPSRPEPEPEVVAILSPTMILAPAPAPEPEPEPLEPVKPQKILEYVRTSPGQAAEAKPSAADFISDRNTMAATKNPVTNPEARPVPNQDGLELPGLEMEEREHREGELAQDQNRPPDAPKEKPPETPPPTPVTPAAPADAPPAKPKTMAESIPEPSLLSIPSEAEKMREKLEQIDSDASQLLARTMLRSPRLNPEEFKPMPQVVDPVRQPPKTFVPDTAKTKMTGSIGREGASSVEAADTPLGRYMREVTGAVEIMWNQKRKQNGDFLTYARLTVAFQVMADGKTRKLKLVEEKANAVIVDFTLEAILEAKIPPMPPEVVEELGGDPLDITYGFILY